MEAPKGNAGGLERVCGQNTFQIVLNKEESGLRGVLSYLVIYLHDQQDLVAFMGLFVRY